MKRLIILRHGEAVHPGSCPDHQRQLTEYGHSQTLALGRLFKDKGILPQAAVCSDAQRTRQTYRNILEAADHKVEFEKVTHLLYLAGPDQLAIELCDIPETVETVLAVGHNPGWSDAIAAFSQTMEGLSVGQAVVLTMETGQWIDLASTTQSPWQYIEKLG